MGSLIPNLAKEVPTKANGLLAADLTSVTYNLLEGVTWSDGQPFTADDVVFTWQWIMDQANNSTDYAIYQPISKVEALSPTQVKVTFPKPQLGWFVPFAGSYTGGIFPQHVLKAASKDQVTAFGQKPIGTGPYVVDTFKPGDQVIYVNQRQVSRAKQAVLRPGQSQRRRRCPVGGAGRVADRRLGLRLESSGRAGRAGEFGKGVARAKSMPHPGTDVEKIFFNFSDPNKEVNGQRAYWKQPHPFFTDLPSARR